MGGNAAGRQRSRFVCPKKITGFKHFTGFSYGGYSLGRNFTPKVVIYSDES